MADGSRSIRRPEDSRSRSPHIDAGSPRPILPNVITPGVYMVSSESGAAAIVTAVPSPSRNAQSDILTDSRIFATLTPTPTPQSSTTAAPTQSQPAIYSPAGTSRPSHHLSTGQLAAAIVVPLVVVAILSPIIIVCCLNWRRRRRVAKRRSDRSTKSLIEHYHGAPGVSRHHIKRALSNPPRRKSKDPRRIVSVPTPTFSSFNFELSRPTSSGPIHDFNEQAAGRTIPRNRRSATFSWGAPPPYTSPVRATYPSTPVPHLDTPETSSSPLLETAQMVHLRPVSGQPPRLPISDAVEPSTSLFLPYSSERTDGKTMLQAPDPARTRQGSEESNAESLHLRSTLQRPLSFHGLPSPSFSDISGLSFDPTLWASTTYGRDSIVSPMDDEEERERTRPHLVV
ncbi:MAG: hypothetical protein Q9200_003039 [Gallowayella weberi]